MKRALLAALVATTFLTPVSAAEIEANSKIDAVTVYPQGAEVTRLAVIEIEAGEHALVLKDLPGDVDPQSIRVEGDMGAPVEIGSVDTKVVHISGTAARAGQRLEIEDQIQALRDEEAALARLNQSLEYRRKLIQDLAQAPFSVKASAKAELRLDAEELGNVFDLVATRLQALDERTLDVAIKLRKVGKQIADLQKQLTELAPRKSRQTLVSVALASNTATSGTLRIKYRVRKAGWRPFYDARLRVSEADAEPELQLVRRAQIIQNTSEKWENVALTLSTARPVGATTAPQLSGLDLSFQDAGQPTIQGEKSLRSRLEKITQHGGLMSLDATAPPAKAKERQADISTAGFQALYAITGRVDIGNAGTAKKVQISSDKLTAQLSAHAVPVLDANAYLTAKFTLDGETPLLPGRVLLFRDNVYMGNGALPLLSPGESHALGFGVDDRIRVKRTKLSQQTSESGLISTDLVQEKSWLTTVENLHKRAMPVKIYDRMPYSTHEDITVSRLRGTTAPTERDVEGERGIMAWNYELAAGASQDIKFGYRISSPKHKPIQLSRR